MWFAPLVALATALLQEGLTYLKEHFTEIQAYFVGRKLQRQDDKIANRGQTIKDLKQQLEIEHKISDAQKLQTVRTWLKRKGG